MARRTRDHEAADTCDDEQQLQRCAQHWHTGEHKQNDQHADQHEDALAGENRRPVSQAREQPLAYGGRRGQVAEWQQQQVEKREHQGERDTDDRDGQEQQCHGHAYEHGKAREQRDPGLTPCCLAYRAGEPWPQREQNATGNDPAGQPDPAGHAESAMMAGRAPVFALDVVRPAVDHRAAGNVCGLRAVVGEYAVDDGMRSDVQLTARHIDVAADVSIDARTARADLQTRSYPAIDRNFATADREGALNIRLGTDLDVPPGDAGVASDLPVQLHVTARGVQGAVDVSTEPELAPGRNLIALHGSGRGDPGPGEDGIARRAVGYDIRARHENVVAETRGRVVFARRGSLGNEARAQAQNERQRGSATRRECHKGPPRTGGYTLSGLEPVQSYRRATPRSAGYGTITLVRACRELGPPIDEGGAGVIFASAEWL